MLFGRATSGEGVAAKLAAIGQHTTEIGVVIVLLLLMAFSALVLAVTLYAITREQDPDLAMLAMMCRVAEGVIAGNGISSTLFSYLLLRGRMIPIPLAWLGVVASALLVAGLPLQLAGFLRGPIASVMWLPMLAFEVPLAVWLLVKGAAMPARTQPV